MYGSPSHVFLATSITLFYLLPTLIAYARDIRQRRTIALVNVVFGWTVAGWIVASIWAMNAPPESLVLLRGRADGL